MTKNKAKEVALEPDKTDLQDQIFRVAKQVDKDKQDIYSATVTASRICLVN